MNAALSSLLLLALQPLAAQDPAPPAEDAPASVPAPTDAAFDALLARVLPEPDELAWEAIGWRPSLAAAIVEAREADKPILLWAMNGHPLGCV